MAIGYLNIVASDGVGGFTYKITVSDQCTDIELEAPNGDSAFNSIEFSDMNNSVIVKYEYDENECNSPDLANFIVTVTDKGIDGSCSAVSSISKSNDCSDFSITLRAGEVYNDDGSLCQLLFFTTGNGSYPFDAVWELPSNMLIVENIDSNTIKVQRLLDENDTVIVHVTDSKGCMTSDTLVIPSTNNNPTVANESFMLACNDLSPVISDIVGLSNDVDGTIDLSTITILMNGSKGVAVVDTLLGLITYTPAAGQTGTDSITFTVKDNAGNISNTGTITYIHTPCSESPVAVDDGVIVIACDDTALISILDNDADPDGSIDISTVEIVTPPFNGTVVVQADGKVLYTPSVGFSGNDIFRYTVKDNNGMTSNISLVSINVEDCCSDNDYDIDVMCEIGYGVFAATPIGSGGSPVLSDVMEVCENGGAYVAGSTGTVETGCLANVTEYGVTPYYNDPNDSFHVAFIYAFDVTYTNLSTNAYRIDLVNTATPMSSQFLNSVRAFVLQCQGILDFNFILSSFGNLKLKRQNIASITVVANGISIEYNTLPDTGPCASEINAELLPTHSFLLAITTPVTESIRFSDIECIDHELSFIPVKFRRTISRTGCPDIIIEVSVTFMGENHCASMNVTYLIQNNTVNSPSNLADCEAQLDITNSTAISGVTIDGVNILTSAKGLDPVGISSLESEIQDYLDTNGQGAAHVVKFGSTLLYIRIIDKSSNINMQNAFTNDAQFSIFNTV